MQLNPLPESADVVIAGAGIAGISTAYSLAKAGLSVAVCEKGRIACEQSSRAFGWIASLGLDPLKMELAEHSKRLWRILAQTLGTERLGYCESGLLHLCKNERSLAQEQRWLDTVQPHQTGARMLSARELKQHLPGCQTRFAGALFQPGDGRVEPEKAVRALAQFKTIHRVVLAVLVAAPWRRIEMAVDCEHASAYRWAQRLGFACEGRMRAYTPDGRDSFLFARIKE